LVVIIGVEFNVHILIADVAPV